MTSITFSYYVTNSSFLSIKDIFPVIFTTEFYPLGQMYAPHALELTSLFKIKIFHIHLPL